MKLKYYLRGMGIGIILTAIVMGFALGGRKSTLSDAEIIKRAKALGMVEADSGVLTQNTAEVDKDNENDSSASDPSLDQEGKEVSEEIQQEVALSDPSVSEVAEEKEDGEKDSSEAVTAVSTEQVRTESAAEASTKEVKGSSAPSSVASVASSEASSEATTAASTNASTEERKEEVAETANAEASRNASSSEQTSTSGTSKIVTIPGGLGSDQVAAILYREGLVDNAVTFNRYLIDRGMDRIIRSGTKTIPDGASYEQIASIITKG
ncbi:hypothetical protein [Butyrivibrio sp. AE2032]|uniref:hypothetical protein n=1 Tax=Butyrivibrio sp. AE2032 TaxID=1458463 RepID=UPI0005529759|nr:hypothetical protein [Butyrivibrio sp. AE2032]